MKKRAAPSSQRPKCFLTSVLQTTILSAKRSWNMSETPCSDCKSHLYYHPHQIAILNLSILSALPVQLVAQSIDYKSTVILADAPFQFLYSVKVYVHRHRCTILRRVLSPGQQGHCRPCVALADLCAWGHLQTTRENYLQSPHLYPPPQAI